MFAHTTYAIHLKFGRPDGHCDELFVHAEDMVFYDGVYYGDLPPFFGPVFMRGFHASGLHYQLVFAA